MLSLTDFSSSAENVTFSIEGGGQVPVLRADLKDVEGNYHHRDINLAERIENNDGRFEFREYYETMVFLPVPVANDDGIIQSKSSTVISTASSG